MSHEIDSVVLIPFSQRIAIPLADGALRSVSNTTLLMRGGRSKEFREASEVPSRVSAPSCFV